MRLLRIWRAVLLLGFGATPALAAAPPPPAPPAGPEFPAWLAAYTDLPAAQVALVGPDNVYSVEPLGQRLSSGGGVVALVRTEPLTAGWGAAHGFQSWAAQMFFDCAGGRIHVVSSVSYPERNRKGVARPEDPGDAWSTPAPGEPGAALLAAACDPAFAWPLRAVPAAAAAPKPAPPPVVVATPAARPPVVVAAQPRPPAPAARPPAPLAAAPLAPTPAAAAAIAGPRYFVQVVRGPSEADAQKALEKARRTLGPLADGLAATTDVTHRGGRRRYTARITGFPTAAAAAEACERLTEAGQSCLAGVATRS